VTAVGDEPTRGHTSAAPLLTAGRDQDSSATQETTDGTPAKLPTSAAESNLAAKSGVDARDESKSQKVGANGAPPQQAQTQPTEDTPGAPPTVPSSATADAGHTGAPSAGSSTISSVGTAAGTSNAQNAATSGKAGADGLPNFGFSPAVGTSSSATDSTPTGSASAAAVPVAGLAVAIAARAQAGSQQFDIRLDPPELGRIDVRLAVDGSGQVSTHVTTERADTLQLLQSQQPQLERALEQAGLKTAENGLQFTLRDQSFGGQNNGSSPQPGSAAQVVIPDPELAPVAATQIYARAGVGGGLDIRV
jgi:flagellar hook-length control protein FliK